MAKTNKNKLKFNKIRNFVFDGKDYSIKYCNKKWKDGSFGECEDRDWEGKREIRINLPNIGNDEKKLLATICDEIGHASLSFAICNDKMGIFSDELAEFLYLMGWRLLPPEKEDAP